jgi:hypothetical protein
MSSGDLIKLIRRSYKAQRTAAKDKIKQEQLQIGIEKNLSSDLSLCVGCESLPLAFDMLNILEKLQADQPEKYHPIVEEISSYKAHFFLTKKIHELTFTPDSDSTCPQGLALLRENNKALYDNEKVVLFSSVIPLEQLNQMQIFRDQGDYQLHVMKTNIKNKFIIVEMIKGQEPTISVVQMISIEGKQSESEKPEDKNKKDVNTWGPSFNSQFGEGNKISIGFEVDYKEKDYLPRELRIFNMETSTETSFIDIKSHTVLSSKEQQAELEFFKHGGSDSFAKFSVEIDGDYKLGIPLNFQMTDYYSVESTISIKNKGQIEAAMQLNYLDSKLFTLSMQKNENDESYSLRRNFKINDKDRISFEVRKSSGESESGVWLRFERGF